MIGLVYSNSITVTYIRVSDHSVDGILESKHDKIPPKVPTHGHSPGLIAGNIVIVNRSNSSWRKLTRLRARDMLIGSH